MFLFQYEMKFRNICELFNSSLIIVEQIFQLITTKSEMQLNGICSGILQADNQYVQPLFIIYCVDTLVS